jgi:putative ABC transport system permease protein
MFADPLSLSLAQAALAAGAAFAVALLARRRRIHVEGDLAVALLRGFSQIAAVGAVLLLMLRGPAPLGLLALAGMVLAAAVTAARRARRVPGAFAVALVAIGVGAGATIAVMALSGLVGTSVTTFVPVGSMLIASAMNAVGLALDRYRAEVVSHTGQVEAALALGAAPEVAVAPYLAAAYRASLIPAIDNLRTLGIVWIPGLMTGMVLSGTPPLQAAIYQFVTIAMIFAASGATCLVATSLLVRRTFSPAEQLLLRGEGAGGR